MAGYRAIMKEALVNARADRKRLEKFLEHVLFVVENGDATAIIEIGDNIVKASEALTRNNSQLIELTKLLVKRAPKKGAPGAGDDVFDAIDIETESARSKADQRTSADPPLERDGELFFVEEADDN